MTLVISGSRVPANRNRVKQETCKYPWILRLIHRGRPLFVVLGVKNMGRVSKNLLATQWAFGAASTVAASTRNSFLYKIHYLMKERGQDFQN